MPAGRALRDVGTSRRYAVAGPSKGSEHGSRCRTSSPDDSRGDAPPARSRGIAARHGDAAVGSAHLFLRRQSVRRQLNAITVPYVEAPLGPIWRCWERSWYSWPPSTCSQGRSVRAAARRVAKRLPRGPSSGRTPLRVAAACVTPMRASGTCVKVVRAGCPMDHIGCGFALFRVKLTSYDQSISRNRSSCQAACGNAKPLCRGCHQAGARRESPRRRNCHGSAATARSIPRSRRRAPCAH